VPPPDRISSSSSSRSRRNPSSLAGRHVQLRGRRCRVLRRRDLVGAAERGQVVGQPDLAGIGAVGYVKLRAAGRRIARRVDLGPGKRRLRHQLVALLGVRRRRAAERARGRAAEQQRLADGRRFRRGCDYRGAGQRVTTTGHGVLDGVGALPKPGDGFAAGAQPCLPRCRSRGATDEFVGLGRKLRLRRQPQPVADLGTGVLDGRRLALKLAGVLTELPDRRRGAGGGVGDAVGY